VREIIKSILITLGVSIVLGGSVSYMFDTEIVKTIVGITMIQVIFFMVYNNVSQKILQIKTEQEITTQIDLMSKQTVELKCAYCGHVNAIPIELSIDNKFECEECGKTNAVYVAITTAQKTEIPDSIDRTKVTTLIQQELEAKREFLNGQT
jgi:hypothetical protein